MTELDRLLDRVAELENILGLTTEFPNALIPKTCWHGYTSYRRRCAPLLGLLLARKFVPRDAAYNALYGDRPDCDQPLSKIIDVYISHLRKVLRPYDITIKTVWRQGFYIAETDKAKLRALVAEAKGEAP